MILNCFQFALAGSQSVSIQGLCQGQPGTKQES